MPGEPCETLRGTHFRRRSYEKAAGRRGSGKGDRKPLKSSEADADGGVDKKEKEEKKKEKNR
jgi:hypothetical protein